jgi:hypothetical protein
VYSNSCAIKQSIINVTLQQVIFMLPIRSDLQTFVSLDRCVWRATHQSSEQHTNTASLSQPLFRRVYLDLSFSDILVPLGPQRRALWHAQLTSLLHTKLRFSYFSVTRACCLYRPPVAITGSGYFITLDKCHGPRKYKFLSSNGTNSLHTANSSVLISLHLREGKGLYSTFLVTEKNSAHTVSET